MDNLLQIEAFKSSPKLVQQLLEYCNKKEYKTDEIETFIIKIDLLVNKAGLLSDH